MKLKALLCLFGFHRWEYDLDGPCPKNIIRIDKLKCRVCGAVKYSKYKIWDNTLNEGIGSDQAICPVVAEHGIKRRGDNK